MNRPGRAAATLSSLSRLCRSASPRCAHCLAGLPCQCAPSKSPSPPSASVASSRCGATTSVALVRAADRLGGFLALRDDHLCCARPSRRPPRWPPRVAVRSPLLRSSEPLLVSLSHRSAGSASPARHQLTTKARCDWRRR
ncbi:hypothetical protein D1007_59098 [Hordeum vulgare]|nr:hypothetical protein D1007_59098 [Hordeum vulgare]